MAKILIVGFGPFPRVPFNPSGVLATRVAASRRFALRLCAANAVVLETTYEAIDATLRPLVARERPSAILMIGVAARRRALCLELLAVNRASRLFPDASGRTGRKLALAPGRPLRLFSRTPKQPLMKALQSAGVSAKTSIDAGRYLCNASYFAMLDDAGPKLPLVAFIHIPMPRSHARGDRRPTLQAMSRGLTEAALVLLARSERRV